MNYGFIKVAAAVPRLKVAECDFNTVEISKLIKEAEEQNIQIIVFPELSITAYTCGDLFHQQTLINGAEAAMEALLRKVCKFEIISIIGMPILVDNQLFNCAVVFQRGKVLGIVPKSYIPCYKEFYEDRWFSEGRKAISNTIKFCGQNVPFGTDILFVDSNDSRMCFGVEICEDLWVPVPPSSYQAIAGAIMHFNLSASNEIIGKYEYRKSLCGQQSGRCISGYIYSSAGIDESSTDLVFGGHAIIAENGSILKESNRFSYKGQLISVELDIERLYSDRVKNTTFMDLGFKPAFRKIEFNIKKYELKELDRYVDSMPFVPSDLSKRDVRCKEIFDIQTSALAKRILHTRMDKAVIGVSGGLDSTLALLVVVKTYDILRIERKNIIAVTMPGFGTTDITYMSALELMKSMNVTIKEINIQEACMKHFEDIGHDPNIHDTTYENVQARERTQILMDLANKYNALVIGTGDLSELALGWCTYNGDHMSMYAVNCSVPKTLVKYLVNWVSENVVEAQTKNVLNAILNTPISPELLPPDKKGNINQKTEDLIGPYDLHDFFLFHMLRYGAEPEKIVFLALIAFRGKYVQFEIKKWIKVFYSRFFSQQFKRSCLPDGPKVGTVSLSPRGDWRMPSDAEVKIWLNRLQDSIY